MCVMLDRQEQLQSPVEKLDALCFEGLEVWRMEVLRRSPVVCRWAVPFAVHEQLSWEQETLFKGVKSGVHSMEMTSSARPEEPK